MADQTDKTMANQDQPITTVSSIGTTLRWTLAVMALTGAIVFLIAPNAAATISNDLIAAFLVLAPASLAGLWLVPILGYDRLPIRWHFLLGSTLGVGLLSVLVLLMGLMGLLSRPIWLGITVGLLAIGTLRLPSLLRNSCGRENLSLDAQRSTPSMPTKWLWLIGAPFLALALVAATNAPGFVWQEEGFGYDILEYHLQMPKAYFQAGHIFYEPRNVYANFPAGVEMLYLLAMILLDTDIEAGTAANMIHLLLGLGAIYGAWTMARRWSVWAGYFAVITLASVGWMSYLSGLAYVELGLLFFGFSSLACVAMPILKPSCDTVGRSAAREDSKGQQVDIYAESGQWWIRSCLISGLLAGFACSCKYTATPMIAFPIALVVAIVPKCSPRSRIAGVLAFSIACLIGFSPWLIKNQVMTGNPVFPLVNEWFDANPPGWGQAQTQQWNHAHTAQSHQTSLSARLDAAWTLLLADNHQRFGPAIFLLAIGGLFARKRDRLDAALLLALGVQLAVWLWATHLFARFAIVLLIPLVILASRSVLTESTWRRRIGIFVLLAGAVWNFVFAFQYQNLESEPGAPASLIYNGQLAGLEYLKVINRELPVDVKILLVGDAKAFYYLRNIDYAVVFNQMPFAETLESVNDAQVIDWLKEQGYTHVLVHWLEINRLRRTYGFPASVTPERFEKLESVGLVKLQEFTHPNIKTRYVTLYKLP